MCRGATFCWAPLERWVESLSVTQESAFYTWVEGRQEEGTSRKSRRVN